MPGAEFARDTPISDAVRQSEFELEAGPNLDQNTGNNLQEQNSFASAAKWRDHAESDPQAAGRSESEQVRLQSAVVKAVQLFESRPLVL